MTEIGIHETKTHLLRLLKRVEKGESFSITNRGEVVAILMLLEMLDQLQANQRMSSFWFINGFI